MSNQLNIDALNEEGHSALHHLLTKPYQYRKDDSNDLKTLNLIMKLKPDLTAETQDGENMLHLAIKNKRSPRIIKVLVEDVGKGEFDVNKRDNDGYTCLMLLFYPNGDCYTEKDTVQIMIELLKLRVELNLKAPDGNTLLHCVVEKKSVKILSCLTENIRKRNHTGLQQLDPNLSNKDGFTALHQVFNKCYMNKHDDNVVLKMIKLLLQLEGIDIGIKSEKGVAQTALHLAILQKVPLKCIQMLVNKNTEIVNVKNAERCTSLHLALTPVEHTLKQIINNADIDGNNSVPEFKDLTFQFLNIDIAKYLIKSGAHVDIPEKRGYTSMLIAVIFGHTSLVELMVKSNTERNYAKKADQYFKQVNLDHQTGRRSRHVRIDIPSEKYFGMTALHIAVDIGNIKMTKALLSGGASVNAINSEGDSVLHIASNSKILQQLLLKEDADVNIANRNGEALLHLVAKGHLQDKNGKVDTKEGIAITKLLVKKEGIDLNKVGNANATALHYAIQSGQTDIANCILQSGLSVTLDETHETAF